MSQELFQSLSKFTVMSDGRAALESERNLARHKAAISLERFCPSLSMAPVLAIVKMVAGIVLNKDQGPNPDGEIV
jgi:hypothetical protein